MLFSARFLQKDYNRFGFSNQKSFAWKSAQKIRWNEKCINCLNFEMKFAEKNVLTTKNKQNHFKDEADGYCNVVKIKALTFSMKNHIYVPTE